MCLLLSLVLCLKFGEHFVESGRFGGDHASSLVSGQCDPESAVARALAAFRKSRQLIFSRSPRSDLFLFADRPILFCRQSIYLSEQSFSRFFFRSDRFIYRSD